MIRKFNLRDAFKLGRILAQTEMIVKLKALMNESQKTKDDNKNIDLGLEIIQVLFANITSKEIEIQIYDFIGDVSSTKSEKIATMNLDEFVKLINEILEVNTDITSFLQLALKNMNLNK